MTSFTADLDFALQLREVPAEGFLTTLEGLAIPYGPTAVVDGTAMGAPGRVTESFARESFDPDDVVGKPLAWRHQEPIGVITRAWNEADGLHIEAGILDTTHGRDADKLLRAGAVRGLSPAYVPTKPSIWNRAKTAVQHVAVAALEISLTHKPAYATAGVGSFREEDTMPETLEVGTAEVPAVDVEARESLLDLRTQFGDIAARLAASTADADHPFAQYRDASEYLTAVRDGVEERALNVSALSEQTGMVPPTWLQQIHGVLDRGRPCINAIGGPVTAGDAGLDIKWPTYAGALTGLVGTSGGVDGTEVTSADIDITVGSATIVQYSGANRLPFLVLERSSPSYLEAYMRLMAGSYGWVTDLAFQTALWANDTIATGIDYDFSADTTGSAFKEAVWAAAVDVEYATGQPADVVYVNSAVFRKLAAWSAFQSNDYPVQNTGGVLSGGTLRASVLGLPIVLARGFATDETQDAVVTNRAAIGWAEDGPRFAQADQPGSTSRDIAIYGYAVPTPWIPAGIVSVYNAS